MSREAEKNMETAVVKIKKMFNIMITTGPPLPVPLKYATVTD